MGITKEEAKQMNNQTLWTMITDISRTLGERESIPDTDKSEAYSNITLIWYQTFQTLTAEADERLTGQIGG